MQSMNLKQKQKIDGKKMEDFTISREQLRFINNIIFAHTHTHTIACYLRKFTVYYDKMKSTNTTQNLMNSLVFFNVDESNRFVMLETFPLMYAHHHHE